MSSFIIQTQRLYLRESTPDDAAFAYLLNKDPEVVQYTGDPPFESVEEARQFLSNYTAYQDYGMGRWYIFLKENDEFIGWCGLKYHPDTEAVDLGYRLVKKHWNKGYATEASLACIDYGFNTLNLKEIIAQADKRNIASIRVMEKIGMQLIKEIDFDEELGVLYMIQNQTSSK